MHHNPNEQRKDLLASTFGKLFKINVDDAVFSTQKVVGVGVIIKDDKGRIEFAISKKIHAPLGAMVAEPLKLACNLQRTMEFKMSS